MQDRFVRSEVDVDGGGYVMFSVGVREREGTGTTASVSMLLERPGEFHAEHREEEVALDPRIAVELCLTYCLDSMATAFNGDVPEEVVDALLIAQASVRGIVQKWCEMDDENDS